MDVTMRVSSLLKWSPLVALARCAALLVAALWASLWVVGACAQPVSASALPDDWPSIATLAAQRERVASDPVVPAAEKARVLSDFDRALIMLRESEVLRAETERLRGRVAAAPARIEALKTSVQRAGPSEKVTSRRFAGRSLGELDGLFRQASQELAQARERFRERRTSARELTIVPEFALGEDPAAEAADADRVTGGIGGLGASARAALRTARAAQRLAEFEYGEERLAGFEILMRVEILEIQALLLDISRLTSTLEALARAVERERAARARAAREAAAAVAADSALLPEPVRGLAIENAARRAEIEGILERQADTARRLRAARGQVGLLEGEVESARRALRGAGPGPTVRRLIGERLRALPSVVELEQSAAGRREARRPAAERQVSINERFRSLVGPQAAVEAAVASVPPTALAALGESTVRDAAYRLVADLSLTLEELYAANGRYLWMLAALDTAESEIASGVARASAFVRDELLWMRDLAPVAPSDLAAFGAAVEQVSSAEARAAVARSFGGSVMARPVPCALAAALILVLVSARRRARGRLVELAEQVRRARTDAFRHTVVAAGYTIVLASALPVALIVIGWLVRAEPGNDSLSVAVGEALIQAGRTLVPLSLLRWAAAPDGLDVHFSWPQAHRETLSSALRWFTPVFVLTAALVALTQEADLAVLTPAIGRPAMVVLACALAAFCWRLLGPGSVFAVAAPGGGQIAPLPRWPRVVFPILLAVPLSLAVSSALGYHAAAVQLARVVAHTVWLVIGLVLTRDLLLRWFYAIERRARFEAALRRRAEARERAEEPAESEAEFIDVEEEVVDYRALGEQARATVRAGIGLSALLGLWALWKGILPAVGALERIELPLSRVDLIDGIESRVPVTALDLGVALLVLGAALFAARNLAGVLGFTVLRRLRFDAGASYAIVTLCQYALVAGGVIYAFGTIGVEWSKLQWLVAALGVGLGFGLQEIVANFVSGIILLLERPVRVGDVVTVGDADGTVARIRIRATTIITWERKELVVPNKEFITTKVLNWTLSDSSTRLLIVVGIAYGSDVRRARELVLEAATETEHVLREPAPSVTFSSFGDNSLNLELRCFVLSTDHRLTTLTAVHEAIYEKLGRAGITIAFPQRDVHLDLAGPLDVRVRADTPDSEWPPVRPGRDPDAAGHARGGAG